MEYDLSENYMANCDEYLNFMVDFNIEKLKYKPFSVMERVFEVDHLLDESKLIGFDLIRTNKILSNTLGENELAIGFSVSDDIIYMDVCDGTIHLFVTESDNGERIKLSDSFKEFVSMCIE